MGPKQEKQARPHLQGQVSQANSFNIAKPGMKMPCLTCLGTRYTFGELWCGNTLCISQSGVITFNGVVKQCLVICLHSISTSAGSKG